eukprot:4239793-Lingulodinium_polyedra.AAC.1
MQGSKSRSAAACLSATRPSRGPPCATAAADRAGSWTHSSRKWVSEAQRKRSSSARSSQTPFARSSTMGNGSCRT